MKENRSSTEPVTKYSSWKKWLGVGASVASVVGVGLAFRSYRIRKLEVFHEGFDYALKVATNSLQKGCSFSTDSCTNVAKYVGYVPRPPQVYDFLFEPVERMAATRPHIIWAPSGTGKSEYNIKMMEERGSHYIHLMCKKGSGLSKQLVAKSLNINSKQDENSLEILEQAMKNVREEDDSVRCLVIVEDPSLENWREIQLFHELNKEGLCDLCIVLSEMSDISGLMSAVHGKQGRFVKCEYNPPMKDSFAETIKTSIKSAGSDYPFKEDDMIQLLDFVDVNFSDFDHGLDVLQNGHKIEGAICRLTKDSKVEVEEVISAGKEKLIPEEDLIYTLEDMCEKGFIFYDDNIKMESVVHFINENVFRTVNSHYEFQKKGMEIGAVAFLKEEEDL